MATVSPHAHYRFFGDEVTDVLGKDGVGAFYAGLVESGRNNVEHAVDLLSGVTAEMSDEVLNPVFEAFSSELQLPLVLRKGDYHRLVDALEPDDIDPEVREVLDMIAEQAKCAELTV